MVLIENFARHAISATQIAAVRNGDTQILHRAVQGVIQHDPMHQTALNRLT